MTQINQIQKRKFAVLVDLSKIQSKTKYNAKITEIESKIANINCLATNSALTAVGNKTPDVSNLVKKADYNPKITDIESKNITTADYNTFTRNIFDNSTKRENLVGKSAISEFKSNVKLAGKKQQLQQQKLN